MGPSLARAGTVAARLTTLSARMVLASRTSRRGSGRRWLVVGLVLTLIVILVDASIKSRSPTPGRQLAAQVWMDRARQLVVQSNVQGAELAGFRDASASGLTAGKVTADLAALTTGAASEYHSLLALREPVLLQSSAGLLQTCLLVRSRAAADIARAVDASLSTRTPAAVSSAAASWATAAEQLQVADQAYELFSQDLPASAGPRPPASTWVPSLAGYTPSGLQVFLTALQSRVSLTPVHALGVVALGTSPSAIRTTGPGNTVEVLSPSSNLDVTAVVGDTGNQPESDLTVTATISASTGTSSVREFVSLLPGEARTVNFAPLTPVLGPTVTLTVTVTPLAGSPTKAVTRSLLFQMPSPTSSATTTTTTPSTTTTTTVPAGT